jgi:hypothetical protein
MGRWILATCYLSEGHVFFVDAISAPVQEWRRGAHGASPAHHGHCQWHNWTKLAFVCLQGIVKKAVGLGGWPMLVSLSLIIEHPAGTLLFNGWFFILRMFSTQVNTVSCLIFSESR